MGNPRETGTAPQYSIGEKILQRHVERLQRYGLLPQGTIVDIREDANPVYSHPDFQFNKVNGEIWTGQSKEQLTPKENKFFSPLCESPNVFLATDSLMESVYGRNASSMDPATPRVMVKRIRDKLERIGVSKDVIQRKWGFGYRIADSSQSDSYESFR